MSKARISFRLNWDHLLLLLVLCAAVTIAAVGYFQFLATARLRWDGLAHDRNAHYLLGLSLALDVLQLDIRNLLSDLDGARVWPPLHGMLVAVVMLLGGPDHRLAVLPSLAGWIGTVVLGFLVARRSVSTGGNLAGSVCALLILASPAHRVFATDVMLESLGACLSLLVLYLHLIAQQAPSERAYRNFALALTALFLLKFNYWLLVAAGLTTAGIFNSGGRWRVLLRASVSGINWREHTSRELRQPMNYVITTSLVLMTIALLTGGWRFQVWGYPVSVRSHHNFLHVAYAALFIRGVIWWRKTGKTWVESLDFRSRQLVLWHFWPIAVWFLLPKRLGYFLFFLSPANAPKSSPGFLEGLNFYWERFREDYHVDFSIALLALGLVIAGALSRERLRSGTRGIFFFILLAAMLTVAHPNRQSRFLHSWIPAFWVLAGVGAATLIYRPKSRRRDALLASTVVIALATWQLREPLMPGHLPETAHRDLGGSTLDLSDYYLPYLAESKGTTLFATLPIKHFARWTFLERYRERDRLEVLIEEFGSSSEENRSRFLRWLQTTRSDTVVFIDVPPGSYFYFSGEETYQQLRGLLGQQSVFRQSRKQYFPRFGCSVSLWTRDFRQPNHSASAGS